MLVVALLAAAPTARAELFETKAKLSCVQPIGGFQLEKTNDSSLELIEAVLNTFYDSVAQALHVVQRCDGATSHTLATSEAVGSTFALTSHGQERYKL